MLPIAVDVTDKSAVDSAVQRANNHFGRIDVVVNNAGYGLFGTIEEISEEQARAQIETNLFGALWVTKAAIPLMRTQCSGHILQVSSIGGVLAFPNLGLYHASKSGLEAFSQSLAQEVAASAASPVPRPRPGPPDRGGVHETAGHVARVGGSLGAGARQSVTHREKPGAWRKPRTRHALS